MHTSQLTTAAFWIIGFTILQGTPAAAEEIKIVIPSGLEDVEGDIGDGVSGPSPFRLQYVREASEFAGLPETHRLITDIVSRLDSENPGPATLAWDDIEIRLSTTQRNYGELSLVFAENVGDDEQVFFTGSWTLTSEAAGLPGGPEPFFTSGYVGELTPFFYDPNEGNLLMDLRSSSGSTPSGLVLDAQRPPAVSLIWALSPTAETASYSRRELAVHQLTFVPEPSADSSDFNDDGVVDGDDFLIWQGGFGSPGDHSMGDANEDGVVDGDDFLVWQSEFGSANGSASAAVPEPASIILLLTGIGASLLSRPTSGRPVTRTSTRPRSRPRALPCTGCKRGRFWSR